MNKRIITALLLITVHPAFSKDWNNVSTTVTLGYESRYVLYGYRLTKHLWHADIYTSLPVNDRLTVWGGSWYGTLPDGSYNEVDFYAGADYQLTDHLSAGLAYSMFNYLEAPFPTSQQAHEISGHLTAIAGPFSISLRDLYDSEAEGHLARAIAGFDHSLTDTVGLSISAEYGYSFDYFGVGDGPNHALFKATLPVLVHEKWTVSPFVAHSLALDVIDSFEKDQFYGGVFLSTTF